MEVKQIYELVNTAFKESVGQEAVLKEDLTNLVDVGTEIFNANAVENYTHSLVDHIGKMVFVNRAYKGLAPKVLMDGWEFGSVLEKVSADIPEATENESWELENGTSYDPNIFYKPSVSVKFFNSKKTFEVPVSITDIQLKSAFDGPAQMNAFLSMLVGNVEKAMTIALDNLVLRTIDNMIGCTVKNDYQTAGISTKSGVRAVNLLYKYNQENGTNLTVAQAKKSPEFLRYASKEIALYKGRMNKMSKVFNIGGKTRFTPNDLMHIILLEEFTVGFDTYLQSDVRHKELTALPNYETVPYWQGSGVDYNFDSTSKIDIKTSNGDDVTVTGVIGVIFDRDALGVSNLQRRTPSQRVSKAEFTNFWYKQDAGFFNDFNENFVVFFIA